MVALLVSGLATGLSYLAPEDWAATSIGGLFLFATYWLCLRGGRPAEPWGLSLGGLLDASPFRLQRFLQAALRAGLHTALVMAFVIPAYVVAFVLWFHPAATFDAARGFQVGPLGVPDFDFADLLLGHLLVVALPEEAFYRGYLQTALDRRWSSGISVWGARLGPGVWVTSAVFALGHVTSLPEPSRLAVFFPSVLFGWLRNRTGGIGAAVLTHASCNVLVAVLLRGFGLS